MAAVGAKESAPGAAGVGVVAGVHVEQEQSRVVERVVLIVTVPPPASLAAGLVEHARCESRGVVAARALRKSQEVFTRSGRASVVCLQMLPDASMARGMNTLNCTTRVMFSYSPQRCAVQFSPVCMPRAD